MTRFRLIILFFGMSWILPVISEGQNTYSLVLGTTNEELCSEALELDDGSMMFSLITKVTSTSPYYSQMVKINRTGNVQLGPLFDNPDGKCMIRNIVCLGENEIITIGEWEWTIESTKIWYMGIDSNFNIFWDKKYPVIDNWIMFVRSLVNTSGDVISALSIARFNEPWINKFLMMKITETGDSVTSNYDNPPDDTWVQDILELNNGYSVFTPGYSNTSHMQCVQFDYDFNILNIDSVPNRVDNFVAAKLKNDSSYYLSGNVTIGYPSRDISLGLYNTQNDNLLFTTIGKPADTIDFGGADQSMDFFDRNSIYVGGTSHIDLLNNYYGTLDNWYILSNFDSLLNLRWTKFFGGDAYHFLRSVVATTDGGAFLIGTRYDDNHPENKLDLFIVKTDSLGLVTGVDEKRKDLSHDAIVYPNPGADYLIIASGPQIKGAEFRMFDMQGKELLGTTLKETQCRLSTVKLSPGNYVWSITLNGRTIESGKWAREH